MLHGIPQELRLVQCVREPTHSRSNMLDLVLIDMANMTVSQVQAPIAGHNVVKIIVEVETLVAAPIDRWAWDWKMTNWSGLQTEIANFHCDTIIESEDADTMVEQFSSKIIETVKKHIPFRRATFTARSHPWITTSVLEAVQHKCEAFGTSNFPAAARKARDVLAREYAHMKHT